MKTPFLIPKLDGPRFDEHTIPLQVMKDWAAFEELLIEVARSLYLSDNTKRRRVPNGFYEKLSLHLSQVQEGSAKPVIDQVDPPAGRSSLAGLLERSRDVVLAAIAAAAIGAPLPAAFPRDCLAYFDQFGKSLRDDERIELVVPGRADTVSFDSATRKKLVLKGAPEYRLIGTLRGNIVGLQLTERTFTLRTFSGALVEGAFPAEYTKRVAAAFDVYGQTKVEMRGLVVYDPNDQPKKIEKLAHFDQLEPNDFPARIEELSFLKDGWLDGDGAAPLPGGLEWLADTWETSFPDDLPSPYVYPTPDGGVRLEWTAGNWELSASLDLVTKRAELMSVLMGTDDVGDFEVDLATTDGWTALANFVRDRSR
ncbi:MAG TPA: hypothetical protein VF796_08480 [Humisphaera sp.]